MKKPSPLLARVLFKLVKKVDHLSKVPQLKKYMLLRKCITELGSAREFEIDKIIPSDVPK